MLYVELPLKMIQKLLLVLVCYHGLASGTTLLSEVPSLSYSRVFWEDPQPEQKGNALLIGL